MNQAPHPSLEEDLDLLARRKQVLVDSIAFLRHMEELLASLETVVIMGNEVSRIPVQIQAFIAELDPRIQQAPVPRLREDLGVLDGKVRTHIEEIVNVAGQLQGTESGRPLPQLDENGPLLRSFHRYTRTAVSLRALLFRRGVPVDVLDLPVPGALIEQQVSALEREEARARSRVADDIGDFRGEVGRIMTRNDLSPAMRDRLQAVHRALGDTQQQLYSGKPLGEMSVHVEALEITALAAAETVAAPTPAEDQGESPSVPHDTPPMPVPEVGPTGRGFWGTLWIYLTTPPHVTWQRARTYRRPGND